MAKQDLRAKTIQELRKMAKRKGIAARREWKKEDFVKALSPKKVFRRQPSKSASTKPARKTAVRKNAVSGTAKKPAGRRTAKAASPRKLLPPLPAERHNDDRIVSMPVTPARLYVYWEIPQNRLAALSGSLNLRARDMKTDSFFYTPVSERIGESFININPGANYSIEIGIINNKGEFVNVIQPESAAAPEALTGMTGRPQGPRYFSEAPQSHEITDSPQERVLPEEFFETPGPVSSY